MLWGEKEEREWEKAQERESSPDLLFSLRSLRAQMFMVCINYWGLENVPHSWVSSSSAEAQTYHSLTRLLSLILDSLTVNPSRRTRNCNSWETELLLFFNGFFSFCFQLSPSFFSHTHSTLSTNDIFLRSAPAIMFLHIFELLSVFCLVLFSLQSLSSFLNSPLSSSLSHLASLCVRRYSLSLFEVCCSAPFPAHVVSNRPTWVW